MFEAFKAFFRRRFRRGPGPIAEEERSRELRCGVEVLQTFPLAHGVLCVPNGWLVGSEAEEGGCVFGWVGDWVEGMEALKQCFVAACKSGCG